MTSTLAGKRAVVVGAGIAGLSAAGALADYFEHVVVLERDSLPLEAIHGRERLSPDMCMRCWAAVSARSASFFPDWSRTWRRPGR